MNKPCCEKCWVGVTEDEYRSYSNTCKNPSCKCHLPKEKVWVTCELEKDKGGGCEHWDTQECECECHKQPHAPEKKWEERFDEEFTDITEAESGYYLLGNTRGPDIKSFIRQLLEEKAVEVGALGKNLVVDNWEDGEPKNCNPRCHDSGKEIALSEAAAILRR